MNSRNLNEYIKNKDKAVISILNRLSSYGIKLDNYDIHILNTWQDNPYGFDISLKNVTLLSGIIATHPRFGRTKKILGHDDLRKEFDIAFREINKSDSLHIQLLMHPMQNAQFIWTAFQLLK